MQRAGERKVRAAQLPCRAPWTTQKTTAQRRHYPEITRQQRQNLSSWRLICGTFAKTDLTHRDYNDIIHMKGKMSDRDARLWYVAHDKNIPDLIDRTKPIEDQARQACDLRNQYRYQARELMADQEKRKKLDVTDPIKSFDELMQHKMEDKGLSYEKALEDIVKTATKTRKSVNDELGVEG